MKPMSLIRRASDYIRHNYTIFAIEVLTLQSSRSIGNGTIFIVRDVNRLLGLGRSGGVSLDLGHLLACGRISVTHHTKGKSLPFPAAASVALITGRRID
jgi:hypothetical protein